MPDTALPTATDFLAAARRQESAILEAFAGQSALISAASELIHALQRERGASNLYRHSRDGEHARLRQSLIGETDQRLALFRQALPAPDTACRSLLSHRLLLQLASALQVLEPLPAIRAQISQRSLSADDILQRFSHVIHALLCVVFELADMAADPAMARSLIALVNLMQCKELAGQERALGSAAFGSNGISAAQVARWQQLISEQEQALKLFAGFADAALLQQQQALAQLPGQGEFERLRRRACTSPAGAVFPDEPGERWFQLASRRMDALKRIEENVIAGLQASSAERLHHIAEHPGEAAPATDVPGCFVVLGTRMDASPDGLQALRQDDMTPRIGRTVIELLYQQTHRLRHTENELARTRQALTERKRIDKAKALLMKQRGLTEEQAHRLLQQVAMNQQQSLADVANLLLMLEQTTVPHDT